MNNPPIFIHTKEGLDFYKEMNKKFEDAKSNNLLTEFKNLIIIDSVKIERNFNLWLDEHDLDTAENLKYFRVEADKCAVRSYFGRRVK